MFEKPWLTANFSYSYVAENGQCVIPVYDDQPMTYTKRNDLQQEERDGAKFYIFLAYMVAEGNKTFNCYDVKSIFWFPLFISPRPPGGGTEPTL